MKAAHYLAGACVLLLVASFFWLSRWTIVTHDGEVFRLDRWTGDLDFVSRSQVKSLPEDPPEPPPARTPTLEERAHEIYEAAGK